MRQALVAIILAIGAAGCMRWPVQGTAADPQALRRTRVVEVFDACKDSVVKFTATRQEDTTKPAADGKGPVQRVHTTHTQWGSGCILHPAGYVLTNSHMLRFEGNRVAELYDGTSCPVRVIAEDPASDLAVVKLEAGRPLKPLERGSSRRVMIGEPAITIGNPFGISFTVASGIVSGVGRGTTTEYTALADMIQTDAPINPGTSGGPLLNLAGEMIGLCTSNKKEAESIGFAIAIDKIRSVFPDLIAAEGRYGFALGLKVATDGPVAVTEVAKGSPAEAAGLREGDIILAIGGDPVRDAIGFHLALVDRKGGDVLPVKFQRQGLVEGVEVKLAEVPLRPADTAAGLVNGLAYQHFHGQWDKLPDFATLKPAATGNIETFALGPYAGRESFAMRYTGYIDIPADGIYAFYVQSDDGSRLTIGDAVVVDNDGLHASAERRGFASLRAGKHRVAVAFFQGQGDVVLKVSYEGHRIKKQEIPAAALWRPGP